MKFVVANQGHDNWRVVEADSAGDAARTQAEVDSNTYSYTIGHNGTSKIYAVAQISDIEYYKSSVTIEVTASVAQTRPEDGGFARQRPPSPPPPPRS